MFRRRRQDAMLQVLTVLLGDPDGRHYGLQLMRATGLGAGRVYPVLALLEDEGTVVSGWDEAGRRYYRLTLTGARAARSVVAGDADAG